MAIITLEEKIRLGSTSPPKKKKHHPGPPSVNYGKENDTDITIGTSTAEQKAHNAAKRRTYDPFVFVNIGYDIVSKGQALTDIPPATLTKLALLACHTGYNDNTLMYACRGGTKRMTLKNIKRCLDIPRASFNRFWASVYSEKLQKGKHIYGNDTEGYTLTNLFYYGDLMRGRSVRVQKMYINALQNLYYGGCVKKPDGTYRSIAPTDHRAIGRVLLLMPYLHEEKNALCWNPYEENAEKILPLSSVDIAKILGIDVDHVSREIRKLMDLSFTVNVPKEGKKEMHVFSRHQTGTKTVYFVNPALLYFGSADGYSEQIKSEWLYVKADYTQK